MQIVRLQFEIQIIKNFNFKFQAIASNTFEQRFYGELQDLWYKARYAEVLHDANYN